MTCKEEFESHIRSLDGEYNLLMVGDVYIDIETQIEWSTWQKAWQAALASQQPDIADEDFNLDVKPATDFTSGGMICTSDEQAGRQQADDGWIEWAGGECPVGPEDAVEVKCKNGDTYKGWAPETYGWEHFGLQHDVIAYRVVKP